MREGIEDGGGERIGGRGRGDGEVGERGETGRTESVVTLGPTASTVTSAFTATSTPIVKAEQLGKTAAVIIAVAAGIALVIGVMWLWHRRRRGSRQVKVLSTGERLQLQYPLK